MAPTACRREEAGAVLRFIAQLNNVLVYVLLAAGFVKLMVGLWLDAAVILGVVIINALLGFLQEGKAEKALDSIRNMLSAEARTVRGGETRLISAEELVPGDVVLLEFGRSDPRRPPPRRGEKPANRRGGADGRIGADRKDNRRSGRKRRLSEIVREWLFPERWSRPGAARASSSPPAVRPNSGASTS